MKRLPAGTAVKEVREEVEEGGRSGLLSGCVARPAPIMLQNLPIIILGTFPKRHLLFSHFILLFLNYSQAYALAPRPLGTAKHLGDR